MAKKTYGTASWSGGLKDGKGTVSTQSGALKDQPYGFNTRFEDKPGTNPEEQIGAALASCYAMAMSLVLGNDKLTADKIDAHADVFLEPDGEGFSVKTVNLKVTATISGIDDAKFQEVAATTKANCPISKLLKATVNLDAKLA